MFDKLEDEMNAVLDSLGNLDPTTEDYEKASKNYERLARIKLDEERLSYDRDKLDVDYTIELKKIEVDNRANDIKETQAKKDRLTNVGITTIVGATSIFFSVVTLFAEEVKVFASKAPVIGKDLMRIVKRV